MCKICGKWHDPEDWPVKCRSTSKGQAPNVISDNIEPLKHHATGRLISSKRAFSKETRAAGCIELGNEPIRARVPVALDRRERREAIQKAIYHLKRDQRP
jgi:hypothetical protein